MQNIETTADTASTTTPTHTRRARVTKQDKNRVSTYTNTKHHTYRTIPDYRGMYFLTIEALTPLTLLSLLLINLATASPTPSNSPPGVEPPHVVIEPAPKTLPPLDPTISCPAYSDSNIDGGKASDIDLTFYSGSSCSGKPISKITNAVYQKDIGLSKKPGSFWTNKDFYAEHAYLDTFQLKAGGKCGEDVSGATPLKANSCNQFTNGEQCFRLRHMNASLIDPSLLAGPHLD